VKEELVVPLGGDGGRAERDHQVLAGAEEVVRAQVTVALLVMGISLASTDLGYPQADPLKWLLAALAACSALVALRAIWNARSTHA